MFPNRSVCTNLSLFDIFQPVLFGQCYGVIAYSRTQKILSLNNYGMMEVNLLFKSGNECTLYQFRDQLRSTFNTAGTGQ